jgi:hypothetical protein
MKIGEYDNPTATNLKFDGYGVVMLPNATLRHKRYIALSSSAKVTLFAILTQYKRHSNKKGKHQNLHNEVEISHEEIVKLTGIARATVSTAIKELLGYRRSKDRKITTNSTNRKWVFEKSVPDSRCFMFIRVQGGFRKRKSVYSLNGYYLNSLPISQHVNDQ